MPSIAFWIILATLVFATATATALVVSIAVNAVVGWRKHRREIRAPVSDDLVRDKCTLQSTLDSVKFQTGGVVAAPPILEKGKFSYAALGLPNLSPAAPDGPIQQFIASQVKMAQAGAAAEIQRRRRLIPAELPLVKCRHPWPDSRLVFVGGPYWVCPDCAALVWIILSEKGEG